MNAHQYYIVNNKGQNNIQVTLSPTSKKKQFNGSLSIDECAL